MLELLCRLAENDGVALICALHQPELASQYFPRVLEMSVGQICGDRRQTKPMPAAIQQAEQRQRRSRLRQSVGIALVLIGGVGIV